MLGGEGSQWEGKTTGKNGERQTKVILCRGRENGLTRLSGRNLKTFTLVLIREARAMKNSYLSSKLVLHR